MNRLIVGRADKTDAVRPTKPGFLLIDDGPIADSFLETFKRAKEFDPNIHNLNPLPMNDVRAREFSDIVFGDEGATTLTVRNGKRAFTRMLMRCKRLDKLDGTGSDEDVEAVGMIENLLLSPVMRSVFCGTGNKFSFRHGTPPSTVVARINRAELGERNAKILGSVLISQFKGQVIVPDFPFYARDEHATLIREDRLIAGAYALSELSPKMRQLCLLMDKEGRQCTFDDAGILAQYEGHIPGTNAFNSFLRHAMAA